jgi:hypothetical protein
MSCVYLQDFWGAGESNGARSNGALQHAAALRVHWSGPEFGGEMRGV